MVPFDSLFCCSEKIASFARNNYSLYKLTLFMQMSIFIPPENVRNRFSGVFRGYRNRAWTWQVYFL